MYVSPEMKISPETVAHFYNRNEAPAINTLERGFYKVFMRILINQCLPLKILSYEIFRLYWRPTISASRYRDWR